MAELWMHGVAAGAGADQGWGGLLLPAALFALAGAGLLRYALSRRGGEAR